jgi:hypothetical protein
VAYFHQLFQKLERTPSQAWDGLACSCADLWPDELMDDLRGAWEDKLISRVSSTGTTSKMGTRGEDACLQYMQEKYTLITDVVKEMAWWVCFDKDPKPAHRQEAAAVRGVPLGGTPNPIHRTEPKVGRNDPCPCGSAKKFKKCCGR